MTYRAAPPPLNDSPPPSHIDRLRRSVASMTRGELHDRLDRAEARRTADAWVYARELDARNATLERLAQHFRDTPKGGNR